MATKKAIKADNRTKTIEVNGKSIELYFGSFTLMRFSKVKGNLSIAETVDLFASGSLTIEDVMSFLLCAAEYKFTKAREESPYTLIDATEWVDSMGGVGGEKFGEVMKSIVQGISGNN